MIRARFVPISIATAALLSAGCRAPSIPLDPPAVQLMGTWTGMGTDSQGPEWITWQLAQTGNMVTGMVSTVAVDTTDGSCASCHKSKSGTVSGTISGTNLTLRMFFPSGGNVPTPMCAVTMETTVPDATDSSITASYTGQDTCEGPFADGRFAMGHDP